MRLLSIFLLAGLAFSASAETVYVTDKLYLGVYKERGKSQFTSISSGTALEVLEQGKSWLRAKLPDGKEGWVKTKYLVAKVPAGIRVIELEKELAAVRAAGGKSGDSGAASEELEGLQAEKASLVDRLEGKELELEAVRAQLTGAQASTASAPATEPTADGENAAAERLTQAEATAESARQAEQQALSQAKTLGSERDQLQQQNQTLQSELQRLRGKINGALAALGSGEASASTVSAAATPAQSDTVMSEPSAAGFLAQLGVQRHVHALYLALAAAMLAIGFWLGIRWLDHRIRQRHGGFQVW